MEWINRINRYVPLNEQEKKDKELILQIIDRFDDVLTRNNEIAHVTSSAFIINKSVDKTLMVHHNIYNSWSWTGGHADGDSNLLKVAIREANEETGIVDLFPISSDIFSLDVLPVIGHFKRNKYVSSHLHLSVCYLLEADEKNSLVVNQEENSGVCWLSIDMLASYINEPHMCDVYKKLLSKI